MGFMPSPNQETRQKVASRGAASKPERQCTAKRKDGERCTRWAIKGGFVCRRHGGGAPQVKAAAAKRAAAAEARVEMERYFAVYGEPEEGKSPDEALLEEVARTAGHVAWLAEKVAGLEETDLKQYSRQTGGMLFERPAVWVEMYQQERVHLINACKTAIAAGIAERQVQLAEQQGQMIAAVIRGVLGDLNLSASQTALVPNLVRKHLVLVRNNAA